jgi:hypothetical protein
MPYNLTPEQEKRVDDRYASVMRVFVKLCAAPPAFKNNVVAMQPNLLYCAIASWVIDEDRHIGFHGCTGLELHKAASYFVYWFVQIKPIQILSVGDMPDTRLSLINEFFAQYFICRVLGVTLESVASSKFCGEFIYTLRYRRFTAESMFPTLRLLEMSAKGVGLSSY